MNKALYVDSVSLVAGAFIGTSSVTAYIGIAAALYVSGLTAVVVGVSVPVGYVLHQSCSGDGVPLQKQTLER